MMPPMRCEAPLANSLERSEPPGHAWDWCSSAYLHGISRIATTQATFQQGARGLLDCTQKGHSSPTSRAPVTNCCKNKGATSQFARK